MRTRDVVLVAAVGAAGYFYLRAKTQDAAAAAVPDILERLKGVGGVLDDLRGFFGGRGDAPAADGAQGRGSLLDRLWGSGTGQGSFADFEADHILE